MSRLKTQILFITCRQSKTRLAQVDRQIAEINAEVDRLISSSDMLAHSMKILRSIPPSHTCKHVFCRAADDTSTWAMVRKIIHTEWLESGEGRPLHADPGSNETQPRSQGQISQNSLIGGRITI